LHGLFLGSGITKILVSMALTQELRSYHNSYLRKNGIISELVDVLAGRVPKTVFARHYLGEEMKALSNQVLAIEKTLENSLGMTESCARN